ncbi:MAG: response regulator transcription factor [Cyclobacteriaceae bacterium]|nr:response regulator transcription factor [Cyclobacteriaceae bacterium]
MTITKKKIIIADDHKIVCEGLVSLFSTYSEYEIVKIASNGQEVIDYVKQNPTDIVVMDIKMPILDGIETTKIIKQHFQHVKVVILSMHGQEGFIKNSIQAGADGYVLKNRGQEELIKAINHICDGNTYFSQEVTSRVIKKMRQYGEIEGIDLSDREIQIMQLLSDGFTSEQIGEIIFASTHTINTYRKNLLLKFDAKNVTELIKKALKEGYIK